MENNKLEIINTKAAQTLATLVEDNNVYCSLDISTDEGKKLAFNASSNPKFSLKEAVNKPIKMVGLYVEAVSMEQDSEGLPEGFEPVTRMMPRMVIIDEKGDSYACVSTGAFHALRRIVSLFGAPNTWEKPLTIVPLLKKANKGQVLTVELQ